MKPIWLMDFDGVLNVFDSGAPVLSDWPSWNDFIARGFRIQYSPAMVARILALHESGLVEIRWLSTWGRLANEDLTQLGFPEFPVAGEMPYRGGHGWWKLPIAQELFDQGHALIWTDDDITGSKDATAWMRQIADSDRAADLRMYAPLGAISQVMMHDIEQWVAARVD